MPKANKNPSGDSLSVYWGEFMVSPVPLELSFNYCSHKCAYCFANLNNPNRWADVKKTMRLLVDYQNRETLEALLLKEGYPVLVSNRVDPFASSNYQQALPVMAAMTEMGIPLAIQTKGGKGVDECLQWLPPSVWYISISFTDDGIRKKIEPGATSISERFELIDKLKSKGHRVTVGINPCVSEWLPDPESLVKAVAQRGAEGVWIEHLHLNLQQKENLSERERQAMGESVIDDALKRQPSAANMAKIKMTEICAKENSLEIFSIGQPMASEFFKPYRDVYKKTFPTMQDFVNVCHQVGDTHSKIPFEALEVNALPYLPSGKLNIGHYLGATAHNIFESAKLSNWMTFRQLLAIIWKDYRAKQNPVRIPCFAFAAERGEDDEWIELQDGNNLPYLKFNPSGFNDFYST